MVNGTRRDQLRSLNALLYQVLRKIVWSYHNMICIMAAFYWLHPQSCLAIKAPLLIVKALSFGGVLYSVSLVQSKENSHPPSLCGG